MIGVIADAADEVVVREFFELFKTPWEFYRGDSQYDVLISSNGQCAGLRSKLVLIYSSKKTPFDSENNVQIGPQRENITLSYQGERMPIYGNCITFQSGLRSLIEESTQQPVAFMTRSDTQTRVRIGFDIFGEVMHLLTVGQPTVNSGVPTIERHIALMRDLVIGCSIRLVEIPPIPQGHGLIACLTHDVDHPAIRFHKCDHTMLGFLYRAVIGSCVHVARGRMSAKQLSINWAAALMLPFVYLGLAKDFWDGFDQYLEIEKGLGSTFFLIPCKDNPGRRVNGLGPGKRASRYEPSDIADEIRKLLGAGCEIGTHGIDAWLDSSKGKQEMHEILRFAGGSSLGVRMHWLYFDKSSPAALERAGFLYDSTFGYNETVGYRAGTMQPFKHLETMALMELPLSVMDTALFYPTYLNLSPPAAKKLVWGIVDDAERFGGTLTVNWHDRSLAPERLWDGFYIELINELKRRSAWFPTAKQAVSWFRKRRSVVFETVRCENGSLRVRASVGVTDDLPGLRIRVYEPSLGNIMDGDFESTSKGYTEVSLKQSADV